MEKMFKIKSDSLLKQVLKGFFLMLLTGVFIGLIISFFGGRLTIKALYINIFISTSFSEIIYFSCWSLFFIYETQIEKRLKPELGGIEGFARVGLGIMGVLTGSEIAMLLINQVLDINLMSSTRNHLYLLAFNIFVGTIISLLFYFFNRLKRTLEKNIKEVERLKTLNLKSKLAVIQAKVNPHFLFNTLNTMLDLVHSEPEKLEKMILNLSDIYRKVLELPEDKLYDLRQEFDIIVNYLSIEKIRMGERLNYQIEVEEDNLYDFQLPPLIMQTIVENAVIHGIASRKEGGSIIIKASAVKNESTGKREKVIITISDNGNGIKLDSQKGVTGFGIYSVKERLKLVYGFESTLNIYQPEAGGTEVKLEITTDED